MELILQGDSSVTKQYSKTTARPRRFTCITHSTTVARLYRRRLTPTAIGAAFFKLRRRVNAADVTSLQTNRLVPIPAVFIKRMR